MNKVAVIGSNSFSGAHFVDRLLEAGYEVVGISRSDEYPDCMLPYRRFKQPKFKFHKLDVNNDLDAIVNLTRGLGPCYVVNFAAQGEIRSSFEDPESHYRTNALGMVRLTEQLKTIKSIERYVHVSTPEVYGVTSRGMRECDTFKPSSPYAASKATADLHNMVLHKTAKFPVVTIRATNVFGPHQQLYRIIPRTAIKIMLGEKLVLDGGGAARKSYIDIRDVCDGMQAAMERGTSGEAISIRHVVETVCKMLGAPFEDTVTVGAERPGQDALYEIDSSKARAELGWRPRRQFEDSVRETIEWIERDWNVIRTLPFEYQHRA
jgi:dTDP-glucose 4,6-dehydratase